jgi:parallel beta-helix repeat protein
VSKTHGPSKSTSAEDGDSNEQSQRFEARIFNITIEHQPPASKYDTKGLAKTSLVDPQDEPCHAVNIDSGRARVQGCEIKCGGLACVAIHGAGEGLFINNTICDGADAGIFVFDSGIAVLTENVIAGNCAVGVHIADSADVLLKHNTVEASGQAGVLVELGANATLEDNAILHNGAAGVEVRHKAWVTLLTNTVRQNKLEGIWIHKSGTAHVEKCTFSQNGRNGNIWVHADCQGNVVCDSNTFEGIGWSNFEIQDLEDSSDND